MFFAKSQSICWSHQNHQHSNLKLSGVVNIFNTLFHSKSPKIFIRCVNHVHDVYSFVQLCSAFTKHLYTVAPIVLNTNVFVLNWIFGMNFYRTRMTTYHLDPPRSKCKYSTCQEIIVLTFSHFRLTYLRRCQPFVWHFFIYTRTRC